jgi:hypothetical protein
MHQPTVGPWFDGTAAGASQDLEPALERVAVVIYQLATRLEQHKPKWQDLSESERVGALLAVLRET